MTKLSTLFLSAAALCGVTVAQAQDKATLDLLVKKGLITQAEADEALAISEKGPSATVQTLDKATSRLTLNGFIQGRYTAVHQNEKRTAAADPAATNGFGIRRATLFFNAHLKDGWSVSIAPEFDGPTSANGTSAFYLHRAGVVHTSTSGVAFAGVKHVTFGYEEYNLPTGYDVVERSAASFLLASNNFGGRHLGLFWDGKVKDTGLAYGAAITNASVNSYAPTRANNEPAVWANVAYTLPEKIAGAKATVGVNTGYITDLGTNTSTTNNENLNAILGGGAIFGFNPYACLASDKATLRAEILGWMANGKNGAEDYNPVGYNLTAAYKVTESIEPVVRFSQLNTNGIGITNAGAVFNADATNPAATFYNDVWSLYGGVNYYILGNNLKVQAGYDFSQLTDGTGGSQIDAHAFRVQLQAMF